VLKRFYQKYRYFTKIEADIFSRNLTHERCFRRSKANSRLRNVALIQKIDNFKSFCNLNP
jgi:hypothetical protein